MSLLIKQGKKQKDSNNESSHKPSSQQVNVCAYTF